MISIHPVAVRAAAHDHEIEGIDYEMNQLDSDSNNVKDQIRNMEMKKHLNDRVMPPPLRATY